MSHSERRLICGFSALAVSLSVVNTAKGQDEPKKAGFFNRITNLVKKKEEPPPTPPPADKAKAEEKPKTVSSTKPKSPGAGTASKSKTTAATTRNKSTPKPATKSAPKDTKPDSSKSEMAAKKEIVEKDATPTAVAEKTVADKAAVEPKKTDATDTTNEVAKSASASAPVEATKAPTPPTASPAASVTVDPPGGRPMGGFSPGDERAIDVTASTRVGSVTSPSAKKLTEPSPSSGIVNALPPGKNGAWEVVKYSGHDYVTAASIQRFYGFGTLKVDGRHVWLKNPNLILKGEVGSMEMLINNVKFVLSYPLAESGGKVIFSRLDLCKLIDPVLRPSYIVDADPFDTVVLDAGHGGHDTGAKGVYGYEKDFALKMALVTKKSLEKRGFKVVMTRSGDEFITRTGRVAIANKTPNSIFISLHFNSAGPTATGIETFALTPQGGSASLQRGGGYNANGTSGNRQDSENIALATAVHAKVVSTYKLIDRGIKRAQWTVLTGCNRPGILFEGGFVTNGTECRLIASDLYRNSLAETIGDAVVNYRKALQPPNMVKKSNPYSR